MPGAAIYSRLLSKASVNGATIAERCRWGMVILQLCRWKFSQRKFV